MAHRRLTVAAAKTQVTNLNKICENKDPVAGTQIVLLAVWLKPSGQTATDTNTRILDSADEIFVRRVIDGARMQELADHAGDDGSFRRF